MENSTFSPYFNNILTTKFHKKVVIDIILKEDRKEMLKVLAINLFKFNYIKLN